MFKKGGDILWEKNTQHWAVESVGNTVNQVQAVEVLLIVSWKKRGRVKDLCLWQVITTWLAYNLYTRSLRLQAHITWLAGCPWEHMEMSASVNTWWEYLLFSPLYFPVMWSWSSTFSTCLSAGSTSAPPIRHLQSIWVRSSFFFGSLKGR